MWMDIGAGTDEDFLLHGKQKDKSKDGEEIVKFGQRIVGMQESG